MKFYEVTGSLSEPISKVHEWIQEAETDSVALPHAMNLSSVNSEGSPPLEWSYSREYHLKGLYSSLTMRAIKENKFKHFHLSRSPFGGLRPINK